MKASIEVQFSLLNIITLLFSHGPHVCHMKEIWMWPLTLSHSVMNVCTISQLDITLNLSIHVADHHFCYSNCNHRWAICSRLIWSNTKLSQLSILYVQLVYRVCRVSTVGVFRMCIGYCVSTVGIGYNLCKGSPCTALYSTVYCVFELNWRYYSFLQ